MKGKGRSMGPEIDRLKKENLRLRDLVKRLADKLETESERPYLVESLIKEARELKQTGEFSKEKK